MHDKETGLIYNRARYLTPTFCRFIGRDPLEYIDGNNLYEYVRSSPLNLRDPYGLSVKKLTSAAWSVRRTYGRYQGAVRNYAREAKQLKVRIGRMATQDVVIPEDCVLDLTTIELAGKRMGDAYQAYIVSRTELLQKWTEFGWGSIAMAYTAKRISPIYTTPEREEFRFVLEGGLPGPPERVFIQHPAVVSAWNNKGEQYLEALEAGQEHTDAIQAEIKRQIEYCEAAQDALEKASYVAGGVAIYRIGAKIIFEKGAKEFGEWGLKQYAKGKLDAAKDKLISNAAEKTAQTLGVSPEAQLLIRTTGAIVSTVKNKAKKDKGKKSLTGRGNSGRKKTKIRNKKPVKAGDRGGYTDLKNRKRTSGQTEPVEMHEMPSYGAKKEAFFRKHGHYPRTAAEKRMVRDAGVTEAVTPKVHGKTRTWRGKNTKAKVQQDADDLKAAQESDEQDLLDAKR